MNAPDGTTLSLWKRHLGHVPDEVWRTPNLARLILADNDLRAVPAAIGQLT